MERHYDEFSNVRDFYFKLKVMYKNTYFEDTEKRNLTVNNCIFGQKLSHIWQNKSSSLVICHIDSFSTGDLTWGEN